MRALEVIISAVANEEDRIRVLPPGPFPPSGDEPPGVVDLGIRLRDTLYRRTVILDARRALSQSIRASSRTPQHVMMAAPAIASFVDTWPLASMIEEAVESWRKEPNPKALSVLHRTAEVIGGVLGWPRSVDRHWPLPDEAWMRRQVEGPAQIIRRGPRDGSAAAAVALNAPFGASEYLPLPRVVSVHGDALVHEADDLIAALRVGVAKVVDVEGWIPWDAKSQDAATRLRQATPLQSAYARHGQAALISGGAPGFESLLSKAPRGVMGHQLRRTCETAIIPGYDEENGLHAVGLICWDDAFQPVRVNSVAVTVLEALDTHTGLPEIAKFLRAELDVVEGVFEQLAELGAVTAAG